MLDEGTDDSARARYALETMLSALGLAYDFSPEGEDRDRVGEDCVWLLTGAPEGPLSGNVGAGCVAMALPEWQSSASSLKTRYPLLDVAALTPKLSQRERGFETLPLPVGEGRGEGQDQRPCTNGSPLLRVFSHLAREGEYVASARDEHGRFLWKHGSPDAPEPVVSEYAWSLLEQIEEAFARARLPMVRKEFWPRGKGMAACLTHDVDVVRRGRLPRGIAVRDVAGVLSDFARLRLRPAASRIAGVATVAVGGRDPYWSFDRISALEKEHGYLSTYFFMAGGKHGRDASYDLAQPSLARLLRKLMETGCEIALHGSYGSPTDPESLLGQRALLESRLGEPVSGHRNHLLRFRAPDSWRAQESAGFSYDSTLGFANREGFRGGHAFPFHPYDLDNGRPMGILEIPLAIMDVSLQKYRRLRGAEAEEAVQAVLRQTREVHGLVTLLWHNDSFHDPDYPGCGRLYTSALTWLSEKDAHVATCRQIDRWWRARESVKLLPLADGRSGWRMESPREIEGLVLRIRLPDAQSSPRLDGRVPVALRRDGPDHLVEFGLIAAGSGMDIVLS